MPEPIRISVLIPLYRGRGSIRACLESLLAQDGVTLEVLLFDNGCPEKTGDEAVRFLEETEARVSRHIDGSKRNIGFAAAMNTMYRQSSAPMVLFLNQDVCLGPSHLSALARALDKNPGWAGVCGTLFRPDEKDGQRVIDTTGHDIFRDRIVRNRGAGLPVKRDADPPFIEGEVFGLSAACALYRREALEDAREEEGPFDPDFFSYFEDIDLDYRLHRAGWKLGYTPEATGTHELAGSGGRKEREIRVRAYGNRRRIMWKHESIGSLLPDLIPILIQDTYGVFRAMITDPVAWFAGPWVFLFSIAGIIARRQRLDRLLGTDRTWIRNWLKSELERFQEKME